MCRPARQWDRGRLIRMGDRVRPREDAAAAIIAVVVLALPNASLVDLPEHHSGAMLAATHLRALPTPLLIGSPEPIRVTPACCGGPEGERVHAAIRLARCDIGGVRSAAAVVVSWHAEFSVAG